MNLFNERAKKEVLNTITSTLPKIQVKAGKCRYNYKCHLNSVHEAIKKNDDYIAMVFYIDENYPIIHFLNYRKGKYIDNTLGEWTQTHDFYLVKLIPKDQFFQVDTIFGKYRKEVRKNISYWNRIFSNIQF